MASGSVFDSKDFQLKLYFGFKTTFWQQQIQDLGLQKLSYDNLQNLADAVGFEYSLQGKKLLVQELTEFIIGLKTSQAPTTFKLFVSATHIP